MSDQNNDYLRDIILEGADWGSVIPGYTAQKIHESESLEEGIYEDEDTGKIYLVTEGEDPIELDDEDIEYLVSEDDEDDDLEDDEDDDIAGFYEDEDGEMFYVSEDHEYFAVMRNDNDELFFVNENAEVFEAWEQDSEDGSTEILIESTGEVLEG